MRAQLAATLLAAALACGCSTCVDADSVPFSGGADEGVPDTALPGDSGTNRPDGGGPTDMGEQPDIPTCRAESDEDLCASQSRTCGMTTVVDRCGANRRVECGVCGTGEACTDAGDSCVCAAGYEASGERCVDIDECARDLDNCSELVNCTNLPGTFQCSSCPAGTLDANGDGSVCNDIDECANMTAGCDPLAGCTNLDPGFVCGDCPDGYEDVDGDGTLCADIDECTLNIDNCIGEPCFNLPGGFMCGCPRFTVDTGGVCSPVVVVEVTHHTLVLGSGTTVATEAIPTDADAAKLVPFVTARGANIAGDLTAMLVDVWVEPTARELRVERSGSAGDVTVEVALVEFGSPTVTTTDFSVSSTSISSPLALSTGSSFASFTHKGTGVGDDRENSMLQLHPFFGGWDLRRASSGGTLDGHMYVVSTSAEDEFEVQTFSEDMDDGDRCVSWNHGLSNIDKAFVLHSHRADTTDEPATNANSTHMQCELQTTTLQCCRDRADSTDDIYIDITAFVVSFEQTSTANVLRGSVNLDSAAPTNIFGTMRPERSMAWTGSLGAAGAVRVNAPDTAEGASFATAKIVSEDQLTLQRGENTTDTSTVTFEVVEWPLLVR